MDLEELKARNLAGLASMAANVPLPEDCNDDYLVVQDTPLQPVVDDVKDTRVNEDTLLEYVVEEVEDTKVNEDTPFQPVVEEVEETQVNEDTPAEEPTTSPTPKKGIFKKIKKTLGKLFKIKKSTPISEHVESATAKPGLLSRLFKKIKIN